jgi:5'(3')-deoxyribonucleotidase
VKRIAFIDVDGVVADLATAWLDAYNKDYGDNLCPDDLTEWNLVNKVVPECGEKIMDYLHDPNLYNNAKQIPGALDGVSYIRSLGYRVVFATASVNGSAGRKYKWLVDNKFLESELHHKDYVEIQDKSLLIGNENILIDDGVHNVKAFTGLGILFSAPHNKLEEWNPKLREWADIYSNLKG